MNELVRVLNLGAGVQSTALFLRSLTGDEGLPRVDCAVFADTQWEPRQVYENIDNLREIGNEHGVPIHVVTAGSLRDGLLRMAEGGGDGGRFASVPLFVERAGERSMVRRQCSREFKIEPVERFIRQDILGLRPGQHAPRSVVVEQWFGISADEQQRARISNRAWSRFEYPLIGPPIGSFGRRWTRLMCADYLRREWPHLRVHRSACIGCPYHTNAEWRRLKEDPEAWADAVAVDEAIRDPRRMDGRAYLHRSCKPLASLTDADLSDDMPGQIGMGFMDECEGVCGV